MPLIVLSDGTNNRTLTLVRRDGDRSYYEEQTGPLIGRLALMTRLFRNGAGTVNRVSLKLSQSDVAVSPSDELPDVRYTDVWSQDVSVFRRGDTNKRSQLAALAASLVASETVEEMVVNGVDA